MNEGFFFTGEMATAAALAGALGSMVFIFLIPISDKLTNAICMFVLNKRQKKRGKEMEEYVAVLFIRVGEHYECSECTFTDLASALDLCRELLSQRRSSLCGYRIVDAFGSTVCVGGELIPPIKGV